MDNIINPITMKYLPLYFEWMEKGNLQKGGYNVIGLCSTVLVYEPLFNVIYPTDGDFNNSDHSRLFWARESDEYAGGKMSPLRQNIILLMAAMNGELTTKNLKKFKLK